MSVSNRHCRYFKIVTLSVCATQWRQCRSARLENQAEIRAVMMADLRIIFAVRRSRPRWSLSTGSSGSARTQIRISEQRKNQIRSMWYVIIVLIGILLFDIKTSVIMMMREEIMLSAYQHSAFSLKPGSVLQYSSAPNFLKMCTISISHEQYATYYTA